MFFGDGTSPSKNMTGQALFSVLLAPHAPQNIISLSKAFYGGCFKFVFQLSTTTEWKSVSDLKEEKEMAKKAAANSLRKNARINIRISGEDLELLKQKAVYEGLPYQTLIASVLHKYVAGHFKTKD